MCLFFKPYFYQTKTFVVMHELIGMGWNESFKCLYAFLYSFYDPFGNLYKMILIIIISCIMMIHDSGVLLHILIYNVIDAQKHPKIEE